MIHLLHHHQHHNHHHHHHVLDHLVTNPGVDGRSVELSGGAGREHKGCWQHVQCFWVAWAMLGRMGDAGRERGNASKVEGIM
eukprot:5696364-Amphidinium_carterae.1